MDNILEHQLVIAHGSLIKEVIALLQQNQLPVSDIDEKKILFALVERDRVIGTGGLEFFDDCALLRSLSVTKDLRGKGLGKAITHELEKICREKGTVNVYLLTETAENFFTNEGYQAIKRADAPLSIKNCSEFTTVCPSTGILMHKRI
jgi:amino-acid N-acetyltransferase